MEEKVKLFSTQSPRSQSITRFEKLQHSEKID